VKIESRFEQTESSKVNRHWESLATEKDSHFWHGSVNLLRIAIIILLVGILLKCCPELRF